MIVILWRIAWYILLFRMMSKTVGKMFTKIITFAILIDAYVGDVLKRNL